MISDQVTISAALISSHRNNKEGLLKKEKKGERMKEKSLASSVLIARKLIIEGRGGHVRCTWNSMILVFMFCILAMNYWYVFHVGGFYLLHVINVIILAIWIEIVFYYWLYGNVWESKFNAFLKVGIGSYPLNLFNWLYLHCKVVKIVALYIYVWNRRVKSLKLRRFAYNIISFLRFLLALK